ncbi:hypothetical protein [Sedimentitalea nanhaiensis]|uniref:PH domain-containing protein n=1 Tax=Sedimentitalea nanhaiensis TaxID=999627 RepID=A0A1I7CW72_9RHOB|nr:hypothetical protein [Sedimentitalea nanhaiensis]SFU03657.1 hypothetical protein SAMN05216236_12053 [Sedimentitalea nanhaiensis]
MSDVPIRFSADRQTYIQSHIKMSALAMAGAMGVLWLMGDPNIWVGAVAGLAAIAFRGWFLASEQLAQTWEIRDGALIGPMQQRIALDQIVKVRSMASFVQVITRGGDKHLIKYQSDPAATVAAIQGACP